MNFWATRRVLVTGGRGFLGSHVVAALRDAGCREVTVIGRRDYDLTQEEGVAEMFRQRKPDIVFHLAGLVGGILANKQRPAEFFYQNLMMGTLVLHYAARSGVEKLVAAGAGCGYPEHAPMPLTEDSFWKGFPQRESAPYSLAKRLLHVQALAYQDQYGFPAIITIPGNLYGPYDNFDLESAHVVPALVRKFVEATQHREPRVNVWGSGRASRDFVYSADAARGMLRAAERYEHADLVNISTGVETSIAELVDLLRQITGFGGDIVWDTSRPDGQLRRQFDVDKARRELGFEATTSIRDGLALTVDWYRTHAETARRAG